MPIGKYEQILGLRDDSENSLKVVGILSGYTEDELLHMPLTEYAVLRDAASFLFLLPEPGKVKDKYKVGDWTLIPTAPKKLTTAQYIDFKELLKGEADKATLLACMLVPEGHEYGEGYDWDELCGAIRENLSVTEAESLRNFFTIRLVELMTDSLTYSRRLTRKVKDKETRTRLRKELRSLRSTISGVKSEQWMQSANYAAALGPKFIG